MSNFLEKKMRPVHRKKKKEINRKSLCKSSGNGLGTQILKSTASNMLKDFKKKYRQISKENQEKNVFPNREYL